MLPFGAILSNYPFDGVFTDSIDGAASAFTFTVSPNNRLQDMKKRMNDDTCDENEWMM